MKCSVTNSRDEQCSNDGKGRLGICDAHRYRLTRYGDVQADRPIRQYVMVKPRAYPRYDGDTELERLWSRVRKTAEHWLWTGSVTQGGAPQAQYEGHSRPVRRIFWELAHGELAPDERVYYSCGEPRCVRISHLTIQAPDRELVGVAR